MTAHAHVSIMGANVSSEDKCYKCHPQRCRLQMHSDCCCDCRLGSERGGSRDAGGSTSTSLSNRTEADVACMLFGGDMQPHLYLNAT